jgi:phage-related protein
MARLKVAFDEGKETVGSFVLDAITPMITFVVDNVIPQLSALASTIGENLKPTFEALSTYFTEVLIPAFTAVWAFITEYVVPAIMTFLTPVVDGLRTAFEKVASKLQENSEKLEPLFKLFKLVATFVRDVYAPVIGKILGTAFSVLGTAIGIVIDLFANLVSVVNSAFNAIKAIINLVKNNPLVQGISGVFDSVFGGFRANGGSVSAGTPYVVGERGAELFVPNSSGTIVPNNAMGGGTTINLTVNGAIDAEGTARTIIDVLNRSTSRGTLGAAKFSFS